MESIGSLLFSVVLACVTICFVWLVMFCIKVKRLEKALSGLQGEPKHWLLGNLNNVRKKHQFNNKHKNQETVY
jgi:hypothetical protein